MILNFPFISVTLPIFWPMTLTDAPIKGSSSSESTIKPDKEAFWATEKLPKHKNKVNSKDLCNFKF
jgi:hypothetical protein